MIGSTRFSTWNLVQNFISNFQFLSIRRVFVKLSNNILIEKMVNKMEFSYFIIQKQKCSFFLLNNFSNFYCYHTFCFLSVISRSIAVYHYILSFENRWSIFLLCNTIMKSKESIRLKFLRNFHTSAVKNISNIW